MMNQTPRYRTAGLLRTSPAPAAAPKAQVATPTLLYPRSTDPLHFSSWKQRIIAAAQKEYGKTATCLTTLEAYVPPEVTLPLVPYTDETDPHNVLRDDLTASVRNRRNEVETVRRNSESLYGFIKSNISDESLEVIKREVLRMANYTRVEDFQTQLIAHERDPTLPAPVVKRGLGQCS